VKENIHNKEPFHAVYLVREFQRHGCLSWPVTSYPLCEPDSYVLDRDEIKSLFVHEANRLWSNTLGLIQGFFDPRWGVAEIFASADSDNGILSECTRVPD